MIAYNTFFLVMVIQIIFGLSDATWSDLFPHLIIISVMLIMFLTGHFSEGAKKEESSHNNSAQK